MVLGILTFDGIEFKFNFNSLSIDERIVKKLGVYLERIIENLLNNQNIPIGNIDFLSEQEKNQISYEFNDTKTDYPKDKTINELFEVQVEKTPNNIAVIFEDKKLTYRELNEGANSIARVLRDKGVKADSIVGIMVERSLEMILGIMGILKAGGTYLPIDPKYPKKRIEYMLRDSDSKLLLSKSDLVENVEFNGEIIDLQDETLFNKESSNLEKINNSTNLVYIIYTSGTSGKPKGAMIEHRSLINRLNWMQKKYPISEKDTILQKTTYTFDVSVWEILWWSLVGAKVCMLTPNWEKDPMKIIETIDKYEVTTMHFVPSMLDVFLYCVEENRNNINLSSLRQVFSSGEALNFKQVSKFYKEFESGKKLINLYGPTEATIDVSYFDCSKDSRKIVPIGKPIDNTKLYILENKEFVPIGVSGELYIAGHGLARGYLNRVDLTAEKFVDNPFEPGTKMYKTGDLARWLPDGNIEFLGRIDTQVKIRGFRIELGEIENRLLQYASVKEAAVLVKENREKEKYICAYVVSNKRINELNLKNYLKESLPEYMVPSYFIQLENMPLTQNGKLDKKMLPEPEGRINTNVEYKSPRNEVEEKLALIWAEVLGVEKVGINDNFFELGGHSLNVTVLLSRIYKAFNVEIPISEIFKFPTINGLSEYIQCTEKNIYTSIEKAEEKEFYKLSPAQSRLYFLQQMNLRSISYNMMIALLIEGNIDNQKLESAIKLLLKRHDGLRTSFILKNNMPVQKINDDVDISVNYYDVNENDINNLINKLIKPFNLQVAPLMRIHLFKMSPLRNLLFIDMHHIISDATSLEIMMKEFIIAYEGGTLDINKFQYKDYSEWQRRTASSEKMRLQERYWINVFKDNVSVLNIPTDYSRENRIQNFQGGTVSFSIQDELYKDVCKFIEDAQTTMYQFTLAIYNIILFKFAHQEDIVIGSPIEGRRYEEFKGIIGMFVNMLALRNKPSSEKTFIEFLREVKESTINAYENQDLQFDELVNKLNVKRIKGRNPLFDVILSFDKNDFQGISTDGELRFKEYELEQNITPFDLILKVNESQKALRMKLIYSKMLFKEETIKNFSEQFIEVLRQVIFNKQIKLKDIDISYGQVKKACSPIVISDDFNF